MNLSIRLIQIICCALLLDSTTLMAQSISESEKFPNLGNAARLFSLRLVPGDKTLEVAVVGYPALSVKVENLQLEASYGLSSERKKLLVRRLEDRFIVSTSEVKVFDLQLKTEEGPPQSFRINLN